jgi:hypothetical protein
MINKMNVVLVSNGRKRGALMGSARIAVIGGRHALGECRGVQLGPRKCCLPKENGMAMNVKEGVLRDGAWLRNDAMIWCTESQMRWNDMMKTQR